MSGAVKTYEAWKAEVEQILFHRLGLNSEDLPDYRYRRDFDEGATPRQAAARAVKHAKKELGV